jgi:hypothetical protein
MGRRQKYSHGQKAECEAQMEGDGVFPPKKLFGYAPKYALSIWGPALKKIILNLKKKVNFKSGNFFFNSGIPGISGEVSSMTYYLI